MIETIKRLPFVAAIFRKIHPNEGTCFICGLPWSECRDHTVDIIECTDKQCGAGFFSVCEYCWRRSAWDKIRKSVIDLYEWWKSMGTPPYDLKEMLDKTKADYNKTHKHGRVE